jgi:hypothetical protein
MIRPSTSRWRTLSVQPDRFESLGSAHRPRRGLTRRRYRVPKVPNLAAKRGKALLNLGQQLETCFSTSPLITTAGECVEIVRQARNASACGAEAKPQKSAA